MVDEDKKIQQIKEIYQSLSETGKDDILSQLIESEDFMARVLAILMENEDTGDEGINSGGYIDFLRKVRE